LLARRSNLSAHTSVVEGMSMTEVGP